MRFGLQRESTISYFRRSVKVTEEKTDEKQMKEQKKDGRKTLER